MSEDNSKMPYQLPFPKDAQEEIVIPNAVSEDERLWVPQAENVWFRPLCLNRSQGYWMNLLKVPPAARPRFCSERALALSGARLGR
jgi:hypothetical protein